MYRFIIIFIFILKLSSCNKPIDNRTEIWGDQRDKISTVNVISIDESLPSMHSNTHLYLMGDSLIFHDYRDRNFQFKVYDINSGKFVGEFAKFGNGPGEIANFGGMFHDPVNNILYGMNANQWDIVGIEIDKALHDSAYKAFVKMKIDKINKPRPFLSPRYINDSTIVCVFYVPDENWGGVTAQMGILNLVSEDTEDWVHTRWKNHSRFMMNLSQKDSVIVTTFMTHDKLCIYDLQGNLIRNVYGPDFEEEHKPGYYYFYGEPGIGNGHIYTIYNGKDIGQNKYGKDIVVMDMGGKYIETLATGLPLTDIVFHEKSNRLFLSTDGEPQFGYIQL